MIKTYTEKETAELIDYIIVRINDDYYAIPKLRFQVMRKDAPDFSVVVEWIIDNGFQLVYKP